MFESVFEAIDEKIERLKTDIFLKNCEIERLRKENEELKEKAGVLEAEREMFKIEAISHRENAEAWKKEAERLKGDERF